MRKIFLKKNKRKWKKVTALILAATLLPFADFEEAAAAGTQEQQSTEEIVKSAERENLQETGTEENIPQEIKSEEILLHGKTENDGSVYLSWEKETADSVYNVYKNGELVAQDVTASEYSDSSTAAGESYIYYVESKEGGTVTGISEQISVQMPEALKLTADYTLTENKVVYSVEQTNGTLNLNGYALTICKDYKQMGGRLNINAGALYCYGNCSISQYAYVYMQNANDYFYIDGNVVWENYSSSYNILTNGVLEVAGDFSQTSNCSFRASGYHKVILSGKSRQTIALNLNSQFNILELNNYSEEGVCAATAINYNTFQSNGCRYYACEEEAVIGYTLEEDATVDGNFLMAAGIMDLNGHTLTVNGDFIQPGGELFINRGKLVIEGDYHAQVKKGDAYTDSTAVLKMLYEEDYMSVGGDFYTSSIKNHQKLLSGGTLEIKGDFYVNSNYGFYALGNHRVVLSGAGKQTVSFAVSNAGNSQMANLEIQNSSEEGIVFAKTAHVSGLVQDNGNKSSGYIGVGSSTRFAGNTYGGDIYLQSSKNISEDITIGGSMLNGAEFVVSGTFTVGGNYQATSYGRLIMNNGSLVIKGNMNIGGRPYDSWFQMTHDRDYVLVEGNADITPYSAAVLTKGRLEVRGNLKSQYGFRSSGNHTVILSGDTRQEVSMVSDCYMNILELQNESEEGIYFTNVIAVNELIKNNSRLDIAGMEGEFGWTLTEDTVYEGDLVLLGGRLDLNGYKLTVKSDFIHTGGEVVLNGGTLTVEGDYRQQSRTVGTDSKVSYGMSNGLLTMTTEQDHMIVRGSYLTSSVVNHTGHLTNGTLEIQGNFFVYQNSANGNSYYNFYASGSHKVLLNGTEKQLAAFDLCNVSYSQIANLEIGNESADGVLFSKNVYVSGEVEDNGNKSGGYIAVGGSTTFAGNHYSGNICILTGKTISGELHIGGSVQNTNKLTISGILEVDGNYQHVSSGWGYLNNGKLIVHGNLTIYNKYCTYGIDMTHAEDYVFVGGNADLNPYCQVPMTDGVLEIKGNLKSVRGINASGNHRVLLSGTSGQEINVANICRINILEIENNSEAGVNLTYAVNLNSVIGDTDNLTVKGQTGKIGTVLQEDTQVDGEYVLLGGTLDLNGHTLTVKGDFIHVAGTVLVHGGTFIVEGDYRQQSREKKDEEYQYSYSQALLNMTDISDRVIISGDYMTDSCMSHRGYLTQGVLEVKGNLTISYSHSSENFYADNAHTLLMSGESEQTIDFTNYSVYGSKIHNLEVTNPNGLKIRDKYLVSGKLDTHGTEVSGKLCPIGGISFVNDEYRGDIVIADYTVLNQNLHVYGTIYADDCLVVNKTLEIEENYSGNDSGSQLVLNHGKVVVYQNVQINWAWYNKGIEMTHADDYLLVYGDTCLGAYYSNSQTNGVMEFKGNLTIPRSFYPSGSHKVILSGDRKQKISMDPSCNFAILELQNKSEEGVVVSGTAGVLRKDTLIRNGCKLSYEGMEGVLGWTLTEDYICEGDFILLDDTLDLNGHTISIAGDFIHAGGNLKINGGTLQVQGDYRMQTRKGEKDAYTYGNTAGHLIMDGENDSIFVEGSFYYQTAKTLEKELTAGCIEIKGNFTHIGNYPFRAENTLVLSGDTQTISAERELQVGRLINNAETQLTIRSSVSVRQKASDNGRNIDGTGSVLVTGIGAVENAFWSGNLSLAGNNTLAENFTVGRKLNLTGNLLLNGYELCAGSLDVNGKICVQSGTLTCTNHLTVGKNGQFVMQNAGSYVLVGGNYAMYSCYSHKGLLTDGILEIRGAFIQRDYANFVATENHRVILSRKRTSAGRNYIQTVSFQNTGVRFHILELRKGMEEYQFQNAIEDYADEIIYNNEDNTPPTQVKEFSAKNITETSAVLEYSGAEDEGGITGYEIYRNGILTAVTSNQSYTDKGLVPGTEYSYQIYAFDSYKNRADASPVLKVTTLEDTKAPERVVSLSVAKRTGSAVTLSWNVSGDNVETAGYEIYRDGEKIAAVEKEQSYKDSGLEKNKIYSYDVVAYDEAENYSAHGNVVSTQTVMPKITSVTPADGDTFGTGTISLQVQFADNGNSIGNKVKIEYQKSDGGWEMVSPTMLGQQRLDSATLLASYVWDISNFEGRKEYHLRFTLYDEDGNTDCKEINFYIDNEAPEAPQNPAARSKDGNIVLTWEADTSADSERYLIYRKDGEDYILIQTVEGRYTCSFTDRDVEVGKNYVYVVAAEDKYGNISSYSDETESVVLADEENPKVRTVSPKAGRMNKTVAIQAEAEDNKAVREIELYLRGDGEEVWTELAVIAVEDGKITYDWDTSSLEDGVYYIGAAAVDSSGNKSEELFVRRYEIDNTGISEIHITNVETGINAASISWEDVKEEDFSCFQIERLGENGYQTEGKVSDTLGYHVTGLKADTEYTFRVVGYDNLGNRGEEGRSFTVRTKPDTQAPVITAVYPVASAYRDTIELSVSAKDNDSIANAVFAYSLDNENYTEIAQVKNTSGESQASLSYPFDISSFADGDIYIRFRAYDACGNENSRTENGEDVIVKYRIDTQAPGAVQNPSVTGSMGHISINWDDSGDDISGYKIYRADMETGIFKVINSACNIYNYYDTDVKPGKSYLYKISAIDLAGNEGECSKEVCATVAEDTEKPVIKSMTPYHDSVVGKNPEVKVLAIDNSCLESLTIQYRKSGDAGGIWKTAATEKVSGRSYLMTAKLPTDGLEEGAYDVRALTRDLSGNESEEFTVIWQFDFTAPAAPRLMAETGDYQINLHLEKTEDEASYELYRRKLEEKTFKKIAVISGEEYIDRELEVHTIYLYKAVVCDRAGNRSESEEIAAYAADNDSIKPAAVLPENMTVIAGMEMALDGTGSSDNVRIKEYHWDMGNGEKCTGAKPVYLYREPGNYIVSLEVMDEAGNTDTATMAVTVLEKNGTGKTSLKITGEDGVPLPYAQIYLKLSEDEKISLKADSRGCVDISAAAGEYEAAAYVTGYLPDSMTVKISEYEALSYTMALKKGDIITGNLTVHRMELQEMIDAGVDFSNPENYNTYRFNLTLTMQQEPIPVEIEYIYNTGGYHGVFEASGGQGDAGTGGSAGSDTDSGKGEEKKTEIHIEEIKNEENLPVLAYISTTQSVSWMKDMYSVEAGIFNAADSQYVVEDSEITLNLPEKGVSLAKTVSGQEGTVKLGDIYGQEQRNVSWVVKGDESGTYKLTADFSGNLMPFDTRISARFETESTFEVPSGEGIVIYMMPEDSAYIGEEYYIGYRIENQSDRTFYNFSTTMGNQNGSAADEYIIPETEKTNQGCVLNEGDKMTFSAFAPSQTYEGVLRMHFTAEGDPEEVYYRMIDSAVTALRGANTGVEVKVMPVSSHITKVRKIDEVVPGFFGDPVDLTTGAFTDEINAISVYGGTELGFSASYSSLPADGYGEMGTGWTHDYETHIEEKNGVLHYYPYGNAVCGTFISEAALAGSQNSADAQKIILYGGEEYSYETYRPLSGGMTGYRIEKHTDGTYTATAANQEIFGFYADGTLAYTQNSQGAKILVEHTKAQTILTDELSGRRLKLCRNSAGQITSVQDDTGRATTFTYEGSLLKSTTDACGNITVYSYDENNRLISAGINGTTYITNTYDDEGRVLTQTDSRGGTKQIVYEDICAGSGVQSHAGTKITVTDADGSKKFLQVNSQGQITEITGASGEKTTYTYSIEGNLLTETDALGGTLNREYGADGRITALTDSCKNRSTYDYDENGNLTASTDAAGNLTQHQYDDKNRLISTTEPSGLVTSCTYDENGSLTAVTAGQAVTVYEYRAGQLAAVIDPEGNKTVYTYDDHGFTASVTDGQGNTVAYTYDGNGRKLTETDASGIITYTYDAFGNILTRTDRRGNTITYTYDACGSLTGITYPDGTEIHNTYDIMGNCIQTEHPDGSVETKEYDAEGRCIRHVCTDQSEESWSYDSLGRCIKYTDKEGNSTSYEYNPDGKLKKETAADGGTKTCSYDPCGNLTAITDAEGNRTTYTYDSNGNLLTVTDGEGAVTAYTYSSEGNCTSVTDANGNTTAYSYDRNGNCTSIRYADGTEFFCQYDAMGRRTKTGTVKDGQEYAVTFRYDAAGRITETTDEEGNTTACGYDPEGNLISITDALGNTILTAEYDSCSRRTKEWDALGSQTGYNYDQMGRIISRIENQNAENQDEESQNAESAKKTAYTYDLAGNLTCSTDALGGTVTAEYNRTGQRLQVTDPVGNVTTCTFDKAGNTTSEKDGLGNTSIYAYNKNGRCTKATDPAGQETVYTYDKAGRIHTMTDELGTVSYEYDPCGNLIKTSDENGEILREYDRRNRITSYTDYSGKTIKYGYDELGNLLTLTYPGGEIIRYEYYKNGWLKSVSDSTGTILTCEYDGNGKPTRTSRGDGSTEERTYDAKGQLIQITDAAADGTVIAEQTYTYSRGIIEKAEGTRAGSTGRGILASAEMTYDVAGRLDTWNGKKITYDACGNMTCGPVNGQMAELTYDCRNRLIQAGDTRYGYDCENNRIRTETGSTVTAYTVDPVSSRFSRILESTTQDSTTLYVYGAGLIRQTGGEEKLYYHYDHLGNTTALTGADGTRKETWKYGTYGEVMDGSRERTPFLYNGQYGVMTDENGLYYMRSRYYSADIKRFINKDVVQGELTNSQSLNRYSYVQGNPVSYTDPFGLSPYNGNTISGHGVLDALGLVPVFGNAADLINAGAYALEGNTTESLKYVLFATAFGGAAAVASKAGKAVRGAGAVEKAAEAKRTARVFTNTSAEVEGAGAGQRLKYNLQLFAEKGDRGGTTSSKPNQVHHFASNKSSKYTSQFESITKKYNLDLDDAWNKELMPHQGRHPNAYHDWMLEELQTIDKAANGNKEVFLQMFENVKTTVKDNPDMLRKAFWE